MRILSIMACLGLVTIPLAAQNVPGVDVWIANPNTSLATGEPVIAHATADPQAYMVIFRVTADNHVVVIAPRTPNGAFRVPASGLRSEGLDASFQADSINGVGHLFAAASFTPFDFSRVRTAGGWNTNGLAVPPNSDPRSVADAFVQQIVPVRNTPYGVNDVAYYVGVDAPVITAGGTNGVTQPVLTSLSPGALEEATQTTAPGVAQTVEPQSPVIAVSQNAPYYNPYGYNPYGYGGSPYGGLYGGNYYWASPYVFNLQSLYEQSCPNGAIVPFNTPCPTIVQRVGTSASGLTLHGPRSVPPSHMYWRLPAPNSAPTVVAAETSPPPVQVVRPPMRRAAPMQRRYYVAPMNRGRRR